MILNISSTRKQLWGHNTYCAPIFQDKLISYCISSLATDDLFLVAADADTNRIKRNVATALFNRLPGHEDQTVAAGHFHVNNGQALDVALRDHGNQLVDIRLRVIELRARNGQSLALEQVFLEISIGKRCAVGSKDHIGVLKEGRGRRQQVELDRPLGKP